MRKVENEAKGCFLLCQAASLKEAQVKKCGFDSSTFSWL